MEPEQIEKFEKQYRNFMYKVGFVVLIFMLILTIITAILAVSYTLQNHPDSINALLGMDFLFNLTLPIIIIPTLGFVIGLITLIRRLWKKLHNN
jgi:hypothetical protein